jgi:D-sedoheptulose 7-phosphate isomerase
MIINEIKNNFIQAADLLSKFIKNEENWLKISQAGDLMAEAIVSKHKIFSCGNGGSLCDAMHFAEELTGRFRDDRFAMPAIAIADPSHITCTANDYGFDYVFSRYLEALGHEGDVLLAISTSGNSPNILKAAEAAKKIGIKVVALTGKTGGKLAEIADIEFRIEHNGYSDRIQELHIQIIHNLIQYIEKKVAGQ